MSQTNVYESPLASRYASNEMLYLFSPDKKFTTWRRLWIALARAEMELGLPVTQEQVDELEAHRDDIDYGRAWSSSGISWCVSSAYWVDLLTSTSPCPPLGSHTSSPPSW